MADSVASSASSQRGWVVPSLAVIAVVVVGLAYSLYQSYQGTSALEKRIATLEAGSSSSTALGTDVSTLKTQVADLSTLKTQVGDLAAQIGEAPKKLGDLETRVSSLEQGTTSTGPDVNALQAELATLKTQIGDVTPDKLTALKAQIDQVAASIPVMPDVSQLQTQVAALDGEVRTLQTQATTVSSVAAPPSAGGDLAAVQADVDALRAKVAAIDLGPLTTGLGDVKAQVDQLNVKVADVPARSDLTALRTRLEEVASQASSVQQPTEIAPLQADLDTLKTRVLAVVASGKADAETLTALRTELDGLTSRVGAIETAPPAIDVTALQTSLGDLKQQISSLASSSDLQALQQRVDSLPGIKGGGHPARLEQIFFDRGSYALSQTERDKLSRLAAILRDKSRDVSVIGFADTQGPAEFNRSLSQKRASAVRKVLLGYGIGDSLITSINALGEDGPPIETSDNVIQPGNRTVIVYANE